MPIWLRRFHIQKINEYNKEENERIENTKKGSPLNPDKKIYGPNIKPSSVYNFKK